MTNPVLYNLSSCTGRSNLNTCRLCSNGKQVAGTGNYKDPKFIVVSDYPGKEEELQSKTLIGLSGTFLRRQILRIWNPSQAQTLRQVFTDRVLKLPAEIQDPVTDSELKFNTTRRRQIKVLEDEYNTSLIKHTDSFVYFTNGIKCKPSDTKLAGANEIKECYPWLQKELSALSNVPVYVAGRVAYKAVLPEIEAYYGPLHKYLGIGSGDLTFMKLRMQAWQDSKGRVYVFGANPFQYESLSHKHYYEPEPGKVLLDYLVPPILTSGLWTLGKDLEFVKGVIDGTNIPRPRVET